MRTPTMRVSALALVGPLVGLLLSLAATASAQFTNRFRTNLKGDLFIVANGVMTCDRDDEPAATCDLVESTTGVPVTTNDGTDNAWIDVDSDATTYNSSSATLSMPAGADVEWAGLYWYGNRDSGGADDVPTDTRDQVMLRTPALGSYVTVDATVIDSLASTRYMAFAEVSDLARAGGNGVYTVANVVANAGDDDHVGGWMLLVVSRDDTEILRHFSIFDGRESYGNTASIDIELNGFLTPLSGPVESEVLFVALDGDPGVAPNPVRSDSVQFTPDGGSTTKLANALNDEDDFGNSTISYLGAHVASRIPAYRNTLGFDVDVFDVGSLMSNDIYSATATFSGDGSETNDAVTAAFKTTIYAPQIDVLKTLVDINGGSIRPGDILEYTVTVSNAAAALDNAVNVSLTDVIPNNATYVPDSTVLATTPSGGPATGPLTDASGDDLATFSGGVLSVNLGVGADANTPGNLEVGESTSITFQVEVSGGAAGELLRNQAEVLYEGETLELAGESYPATAFSHPPVGAGPTTGAVSSDDDGLPDDEDPDDDNDGILDSVESPGFAGDPGDDADADGIPAWNDPDEVPGGCTDDGGSPARCTSLPAALDGDGDGIPNHRDRDADGDGIPDTVETGTTADLDGDGIPDDLTDTDGDGVIDAFDAAFDDDTITTTNFTPRDTGDGDGLADFLDRDSDGDGLTDAYEAGYADIDGDGVPDAHVDGDGDGLIDSLVTPRNTDAGSDSDPDYIDDDSDGDGIGDRVEAFDTSGDGTLDGGEAAPLANDDDGDGIDDQYDPDCPGGTCAGGSTQVDPTSLTGSQDANGDGTPDWLQACGDAYVTGSEGCDDGNQTDGDACSNACLRGLDVACTDSAQCASAACHDDTSACEICTDDATGSADTGCGGATPVCIESSGDGSCVECEDDQSGTTTDDGCSGGTPLCDDGTNTCVACLDDASGAADLGCDGASPVCDSGTGACVECEDSDTGTTNADVDFGCSTLPFCDAGTDTCIECLNANNCDDANPCTTGDCDSGSCTQDDVALGTSCNTGDVCDGAGSCEDCANLGSGQDPGCDVDAPFCNAAEDAAGTCVECLGNDDCAVDEFCNPMGQCAAGCNSNDDCDTGTCDETSMTCVTCVDSAAGGAQDEGCDDPDAPVCDGAAGSGMPGSACVGCNDDGQCAGVCETDENECVTCYDGGTGTDPGCDGGTPFCNTTLASEGVCVACLTNGDCGAGEFCNAAGQCMAGCAEDDDCDTGVCDEPNGTCVACVDSAAGTDTDDGCDADTPVCAGAAGDGTAGSACVACELDDQCSGACSPDDNTCVTCRDAGAGTDPGCDGDAPHCDDEVAGGVCRACLQNGDCDDGEYCDEENTCRAGCDSDDDCEGGVCHTASNMCAACVDTADGDDPDNGCTDEDLPACAADEDGGPGEVCVACTEDSGCPGVCDTEDQRCVVCEDTGDETDKGCEDDVPHCLDDDGERLCGECRDNDDCGEGEHCDPSHACSSGCDSDDDCGEDQRCDDDGMCVRTDPIDSDGDGIPDDVECEDVDDCQDTDGDGMPDHMDEDDDGDGIPTKDEAPDEDGDGDPDDARDTDGDGIPDYLDDDDDDDGIPTEDERGDRDGDGVPDHLAPPTLLTGGYRGGAGCSVDRSPDAPSTAGLGFLSLMTIAALRRRRRGGREQA